LLSGAASLSPTRLSPFCHPDRSEAEGRDLQCASTPPQSKGNPTADSPTESSPKTHPPQSSNSSRSAYP
jgi:hypothetical protein